MSFRWLNKQGVESDLGFIVQVVKFGAIEYREADRTLTVDFEIGVNNGQSCCIISPGCFAKWDDMPEGSNLPEDERERIERNFLEAMKFQGVVVLAEDPEY